MKKQKTNQPRSQQSPPTPESSSQRPGGPSAQKSSEGRNTRRIFISLPGARTWRTWRTVGSNLPPGPLS
eukprot:4708422-Prymnesium_polylepis.1